MGYRPFIDSPLDSIDMIDSMMMISLCSLLFISGFFVFHLSFGYMNQGYFGGIGPKMCITKV
jgi:hypothetical protein